MKGTAATTPKPTGKPGYADWLDLDVEDGVALMTRSGQPFETFDELTSAYESFVAALEACDADCLLTDLRAAPGRNDRDFEQFMLGIRRRIYQAFSRRAVVVGTELGRLHVARHARTDGFEVGVFLDKDEALAWLRREAGH